MHSLHGRRGPTPCCLTTASFARASITDQAMQQLAPSEQLIDKHPRHVDLFFDRLIYTPFHAIEKQARAAWS